jgi:hypothetical protein
MGRTAEATERGRGLEGCGRIHTAALGMLQESRWNGDRADFHGSRRRSEGRARVHSSSRRLSIRRFRNRAGSRATRGDVRAADGGGFTPLHCACSQNRREAVSSLLDCGADMCARSEEGFQPLHFACEKGCEEIVGPYPAAPTCPPGLLTAFPHCTPPVSTETTA